MSRTLRDRGAVRATLGLGACLALAACGSGTPTVTTVPVGARANGSGSKASMAGMGMAGSGANMKVGGIRPIPTRVLATTKWQNMKITARAMTAVPFVVFDGTHERTIKPPKHVSFHLMIMLNDARSNQPIPYAGVWATIRKAGKLVYDERQWPMLSEYMGPHYGNDVALPGSGHYQLGLLISPPVSARHMEYQHVWLKPHRVTVSFDWKHRT